MLYNGDHNAYNGLITRKSKLNVSRDRKSKGEIVIIIIIII